MPTLLVINSSLLKGRSVSRELTTSFVHHWTTSRAGGTITDRDLYGVKIEPTSADWVAAAFTPEAAPTPGQKDVRSLSDTFIDGVTDTTLLTAGGASALNHGVDRAEFLAPHLETVRPHVRSSQGGQA